MNGEERAGMGDKPDKTAFVAALQMRRNSDTFTSFRKSLCTFVLWRPDDKDEIVGFGGFLMSGEVTFLC